MVETTGPARMCPVQRAAGSEAKDDMTEVMSDKDLLDALDPDQPGLESVCEAMSAADLGEAKQRLINYFRNRRDAGPPAILRARRFASASNCLSWQYFCISKSSTHSAEHFERMMSGIIGGRPMSGRLHHAGKRTSRYLASVAGRQR
jgi:methylphosphotriester-DNA--protein-cysteine methyltransferase